MYKKMILCFDTSGVNALKDDSDSASFIARIEAGFHTRLTATNVEEIIATSKRDERNALLDVCQQLLHDGDCIQPHHWITGLLIRDHERYGKSSWASLDIRARMYEQEIVRREAIDALSQEQKLAAQEGEKQFAGVFEAARPAFDKLFASGEKRPPSFGETLAHLQAPGGAFWSSYGAALYGRITGSRPSEDKVRKFVAECPPFRCLLIALTMAQYERCIRNTKTGDSYRAGRSDLLCAVYMPYCDVFNTSDERQERCLREIASAAGLNVSIRSYKDFRKVFLF